jgi:hypothetical protein
MRKSLTIVAALVAAVIAVAGIVMHAQIVPSQVSCLHGRPERPADVARREQAGALLKALNQAEGQSLERSRRFAPLSELAALPRTPDGFRLRLYLSDAGYVASLKDGRDPCYFGLFSDESGFVYSAAPFTVPLVAMADRVERRR